jgi:hypothetical protein
MNEWYSAIQRMIDSQIGKNTLMSLSTLRGESAILSSISGPNGFFPVGTNPASSSGMGTAGPQSKKEDSK